jgi:hypothetical protein
MVVTTYLIPGSCNTAPTPGTRLRNINTVGKNPENNAINPYPSTHNPKNGHPYSTNANPNRKQNAPRWFLGFTKNFTVCLGPMVVVTPDKNIKFPIANRPRSKKNITPNAVNAHPNVVRPMPISV